MRRKGGGFLWITILSVIVTCILSILLLGSHVSCAGSNAAILLMNDEAAPQQDAHTTVASSTSKTKIAGFTDVGFVILAMRWYDKLEALGYNQHVIVGVDQASIDFFAGTNYRVEDYIVPRNNTLNWRRQVFRARVEYCMKQIEQGTSLLLTDVDNTFNRYVNLDTFANSEYDIYHAYGTVFPRNVLDLQGFVVCGGHIWYTANARTLSYLRRILDLCGRYECDDQVIINSAMVLKMKMEWDDIDDDDVREQNEAQKQENHRKRQHERYGVAERTGRSELTGHTVMIWHRDLAYRGPVNPDICPRNNWVAMPLDVPKKFKPENLTEVPEKLKRIALWEKYCGRTDT